jgi:hypothetical protein
MVPTTPIFSFLSEGTGGVGRDLTPTQVGLTSRVGGSLRTYPPWGLETAVTAWGFQAGAAPPGASTLTVLARGFTFVRTSVTASPATPAPMPTSGSASTSSNPLHGP